MKKRNCYQCSDSFTPARNPKQSYCSKLSCQNARKNAWRKQKRQDDPDYREDQKRTHQQWLERKQNYWRDYRDSHPKYVQGNREQTRLRKQKRASNAVEENTASRFAKSDAFNDERPIKSGIYQLIPVPPPGFAKSDALMVEISLIT